MPTTRAWGDSYWNQNNRLLYWPLIASGDISLIKPWFSMYINALPLAKAKDRIYNQQDGASYPETMHFGDYLTWPTLAVITQLTKLKAAGNVTMCRER